jgi:NAD-dependent DNA ligase
LDIPTSCRDTSSKPGLRNTSFYIIGDSNTKKLNITEENIQNKSVPGLSLNNCEDVIDSVKDYNVSRLIIHLGTNDIGRNVKNNVLQKAKNALTAANKKWPTCPIAFSSIIPRMGNSAAVKRINSDAKFVNQKILQFCQSNGYHFLDNDKIFKENNKIVPSLYDDSDPTGIHISKCGADQLYISMTAFFINGKTDQSGTL